MKSTDIFTMIVIMFLACSARAADTIITPVHDLLIEIPNFPNAPDMNLNAALNGNFVIENPRKVDRKTRKELERKIIDLMWEFSRCRVHSHMERKPDSEASMKSFKRYISEQNEATINDFVGFASRKLGLKNTPSVTIVPTRQDGMTTASYSPSDCTIKVVGGNRATFDVCRSIAHELVHQMQDECGDDLDGETGSPCEDEANALAGRLIRMYGAENEAFYEE